MEGVIASGEKRGIAMAKLANVRIRRKVDM
jgi:hypothetical protein